MGHAPAAAHAGDHLKILVEKIELVAHPLAVTPPLFLPGVVDRHFGEVREGTAIPTAETSSLAGQLQIAEVKAMAGRAEVSANPAVNAFG
jgi:hypothetical protein